MTIYEIDAQIFSLIDDETGEIKDFDAWDALQMEREKKIENTALWYKEILAEVAGMEIEKKNLEERIKHAKEKELPRLKRLLYYGTQGRDFSTERCEVKRWRKTHAVNITDETACLDYLGQRHPDALITKVTTTVSVSKKAVKELIEAGESVEGAEIVENNSAQIK